MRTMQTQADFLQTLLLHGSPEERQRMLTKITRACREERWSRRGLSLGVFLATVYLYALWFLRMEGLGMILDETSIWADVADGTGIGLLLCVAVLLGHWLWQRGFLHQVEDESRRYVLGVLESRSPSRDSGEVRTRDTRPGPPTAQTAVRQQRFAPAPPARPARAGSTQ